MPPARISMGFAVLSPFVVPSDAASFHQRSSRRTSGLTLRRCLHANPLIFGPGHIDLEWAGAIDTSGS